MNFMETLEPSKRLPRKRKESLEGLVLGPIAFYSGISVNSSKALNLLSIIAPVPRRYWSLPTHTDAFSTSCLYLNAIPTHMYGLPRWC